jgi:hypothetical protein
VSVNVAVVGAPSNSSPIVAVAVAAVDDAADVALDVAVMDDDDNAASADLQSNPPVVIRSN